MVLPIFLSPVQEDFQLQHTARTLVLLPDQGYQPLGLLDSAALPDCRICGLRTLTTIPQCVGGLQFPYLHHALLRRV